MTEDVIKTRRKTKKKTEENDMPAPLFLDKFGREIDDEGNLKSTKTREVATIMLNKKKKDKKSKMDQVLIPSNEPEVNKTDFVDPNLPNRQAERKKRAFHFLEAGALVKKADKIRAKLRGEDDDGKKDEQVVPKMEDLMALVREDQQDQQQQVPLAKRLSKENPPDFEWWDKFLLPGNSYDAEKLVWDDVSIYIEHPVPIQPPSAKPNEPITFNMYYTKKEQRKLRRRTRMEKEREKHENQILGLIPPEKPKVKISNLPRVLGLESVADPTMIEEEVRRQVAERQAEHEARNAARKLTKEQKVEKKKKKLEEDTKKGTIVALFKINDLTHPKHKYKIDINAKELGLGGCAIIFNTVNMVMVEGSATCIRKFKKLMMTRIKWNGEPEEENSEKKENAITTSDPSKPPNKCFLVWEGAALKPNFNNQFRFEALASEDAIRKYLNHRWSEQYWDMCKNYKEDLLVTTNLLDF